MDNFKHIEYIYPVFWNGQFGASKVASLFPNLAHVKSVTKHDSQKIPLKVEYLKN